MYLQVVRDGNMVERKKKKCAVKEKENTLYYLCFSKKI